MFQRVRGHYLWPEPLTRDSMVVDAGAHHGEFSSEIIQRFTCRCHLVEANPVLAAQLSVPGAASITTAALGVRDGQAVFHQRANPESGSIGGSSTDVINSVSVEVVSLPTLLQRVGAEHIDLLKLDIEGAEFDLIEQTSDEIWRKVGQITVEFHDFQEHFAGRGLFERARTRLEQLGFICCLMSFRTHGDVLFLNRHRLPLSALRSFYGRRVARFVEKAKARLS
jgi:FkbM family methyltransferase